MKDIPELRGREELAAWIRQHFDDAVNELINTKVLDSLLVEAKPAWVLPFKTLIGQAREKGQPGGGIWFICGDVPLDFIPASAASTPKEAARHFSLKWQMDASRDGATDKAIVARADALYRLTEDERIWLQG